VVAASAVAAPIRLGPAAETAHAPQRQPHRRRLSCHSRPRCTSWARSSRTKRSSPSRTHSRPRPTFTRRGHRSLVDAGPETRDPRLATRDPGPETRDPGTSDKEARIRSPLMSRVLGLGSRVPCPGSRVSGVGSRVPSRVSYKSPTRPQKQFLASWCLMDVRGDETLCPRRR